MTIPLDSRPPSHRTAIMVWTLAAVVLCIAFWGGLRFRRQAYDVLVPVHFKNDINRGWGWGYYTFQNMHDRGRSFLDTYDDVGAQDVKAPNWIDYPPGRLVVLTAWAGWNHRTTPYAARTEDLAAQVFFLSFSAVLEFLAAAAAFLLTRRVARLAEHRDGSVHPGTGLLPATVAAILIWLNPALVISSHGWPSADAWVIAPFLWAAYLGHRRNWFGAGVVIAFGLLLDANSFVGATALLLWPLFQMRWRDVLRYISGAAGTFGLPTSGWTLTRIDAGHARHISWAALCCVIAIWLIAIGVLLAKRQWSHPALRRAHPRVVLMSAFAFAGAMSLASMHLFGTSHAWFDAGYAFGGAHWEQSVVGVTSNLYGLLQARYGWSDPATVVFTWGTTDIPLRTLLLIIFSALMVLTSAGIAWHHRRFSRRFLVAIVTPWLLFYAVPAQIHERYLLFGAVAAAVCCGYSLGMTLLGIFLTFISGLMTLHVLLARGSKLTLDVLLHEQFPSIFEERTRAAFTLQRFITGMHPDLAWALLLIVAVFVFFSITPERRRRPIAVVAVEPLPTNGLTECRCPHA